MKSKDKTTDKDLISQFKKGTETTKTATPNDNDMDWEKVDSEEEETTQEKRGVITQQAKGTSDKPKKLADLFSDTTGTKSKPAPKKPTTE